MDSSSGTTIAGPTYDQQVMNMKNKRKKFNPKYMLSNSSSDDEGGGSLNHINQLKRNSDVTENGEEHDGSSDEDSGTKFNNNNIPNTNFSITKGQNNNSDGNSQSPFSTASKLSLLQNFANLTPQQQLLQHAAMAAVSSASSMAPQFQQQQLQQNPSMNLSETEARFREFAFKTMQDLLSIYGLSLSPNDIVDALKQQQHLGKFFLEVFSHNSLL